MKHCSRWTLIAAILAAGSQPAGAQATRSDDHRVDDLFKRYAPVTGPGCAVAAQRDGRTIVERAYGSANLEHHIANTVETVFEAGSVSKQFTAAAILVLTADKRLHLTDSVRRFVPELPKYADEMTVDHLLNHTSGLRDWGDVSAIAGWPRGTRAYTPDDVLEIARRQRSLNYAPGTEYSYTNTGYNLLALIVERVSGKTLAQFTRERLFLPLNMKSTQWRDDFRRTVDSRAVAYDLSDGAYVQDMPFEDAYGNGGLLTTVGDLLLWNQALTDGSLGWEVTEALQKASRLKNGRAITYARGLFVQPYGHVREVSHGGATGGYRAWLGRYPDQRVSVALLCNAGDANAAALARGVADRLLPSRSSPPATSMRTAETAGRAGLYVNQSTGFPLRLDLTDGRLKMGKGAFLEPVSGNLYRAPGSQFEFLPDGSLRATSSEGQTAMFLKVEEHRPSGAELARYVGVYSSDEADASYAVKLQGDRLVMSLARRPHISAELSPIYKNAFEFGSRIVRFPANEGPPASYLSIGSSRVRDLRFQRVP